MYHSDDEPRRKVQVTISRAFQDFVQCAPDTEPDTREVTYLHK